MGNTGQSDLALDELFRWQMPVKVTVKGREVDLLLKTLGAAAQEKRQNLALAASRAAVKDFDTPGTVLYINRRQIIDEDLQLNTLRGVALALQRDAFIERSRGEVMQIKDENPRPPGSLTDVIERESEDDQDRDHLLRSRQEWVEQAMISYQADLDVMTEDALRDEVRRLVRELVAREAFIHRWVSTTLYHAVWTPDGNRRYYGSIEDWDDADPEFRDAVIDQYLILDRASQDPNS